MLYHVLFADLRKSLGECGARTEKNKRQLECLEGRVEGNSSSLKQHGLRIEHCEAKVARLGHDQQNTPSECKEMTG